MRILSVVPDEVPDTGAAAQRHAVIQQAVERSEALDMARLALTVDVKWGSYDPDVILRVIDNLKTLISPVLPHSAQKIVSTLCGEYLGYEGQLFGTQRVVEYLEATRSHPALTYDHTGATGTWAPGALPVGQALRQPAPLFKRLDEGVVKEEYARLEGSLCSRRWQRSLYNGHHRCVDKFSGSAYNRVWRYICRS